MLSLLSSLEEGEDEDDDDGYSWQDMQLVQRWFQEQTCFFHAHLVAAKVEEFPLGKELVSHWFLKVKVGSQPREVKLRLELISELKWPSKAEDCVSLKLEQNRLLDLIANEKDDAFSFVGSLFLFSLHGFFLSPCDTPIWSRLGMLFEDGGDIKDLFDSLSFVLKKEHPCLLVIIAEEEVEVSSFACSFFSFLQEGFLLSLDFTPVWSCVFVLYDDGGDMRNLFGFSSVLFRAPGGESMKHSAHAQEANSFAHYKVRGKHFLECCSHPPWLIPARSCLVVMNIDVRVSPSSLLLVLVGNPEITSMELGGIVHGYYPEVLTCMRKGPLDRVQWADIGNQSTSHVHQCKAYSDLAMKSDIRPFPFLVNDFLMDIILGIEDPADNKALSLFWTDKQEKGISPLPLFNFSTGFKKGTLLHVPTSYKNASLDKAPYGPLDNKVNVPAASQPFALMEALFTVLCCQAMPFIRRDHAYPLFPCKASAIRRQYLSFWTGDLGVKCAHPCSHVSHLQLNISFVPCFADGKLKVGVHMPQTKTCSTFLQSTRDVRPFLVMADLGEMRQCTNVTHSPRTSSLVNGLNFEGIGRDKLSCMHNKAAHVIGPGEGPISSLFGRASNRSLIYSPLMAGTPFIYVMFV